MTPRVDTGHSFGFYRVLLSADGHAVLFGATPDEARRVDAEARLYAELGLTGYRLGWLPPGQAQALHGQARMCDGCRIRLSCGCDMEFEVLTGRCRHGTRKAIQAAAKRCGYLDDVPPPAATQAGLDALADQLVAAETMLRPRRRRGRR